MTGLQTDWLRHAASPHDTTRHAVESDLPGTLRFMAESCNVSHAARDVCVAVCCMLCFSIAMLQHVWTEAKKNKVGDLILPIAAIRGEGTSNDYLPPEVPALPAFAMQKAISTTIREYDQDYWTGTIYTTNKRVWEHRKDFKKYLKSLRPIAIDMETATIFVAAFKNH